jgi:hypothetical protein
VGLPSLDGSAKRSASEIALVTENMASVPEQPLCERLTDRLWVFWRFKLLIEVDGVISIAERLQPEGCAGISSRSCQVVSGEIQP